MEANGRLVLTARVQKIILAELGENGTVSLHVLELLVIFLSLWNANRPGSSNSDLPQ
jgi:hypothetical protein